MKKLKLVLTRDFNQWSNQMPRDLILHSFPKIFKGAKISDQIIIFDGKSFGWHRFVVESEKLKQGILKLPLTHKAFQIETHEIFRDDVKKIRQWMKVNPATISDPKSFYHEYKTLFSKLYPYYAFAMFLPGPWGEDFRKKHGQKSEKAIEIAYQSRIRSEGLAKEVTNFMRSWLGPILAKNGIPADYLKLMTVEEIEDFIYKNKFPIKNILAERNRGFVSIKNKIYPTRAPREFLSKRGIILVEESGEKDKVKGQVAFKSKKVTGVVCVIVATSDVQKLKTAKSW